MRWHLGILVTIAGCVMGCVMGCMAGCIDAPALHGRTTDGSIGAIADASSASSAETVRVRVEDELGVGWPVDAAPRRPVLVVEPGVSGATEPVFLFRGDADADLLDDLERPPLLVAHQARRVATTLLRTESRTEARPTEALEPGATYTFAVGGWATKSDGSTVTGVLSVAFRIGTTQSGAVLAEAFPASGTSGVDPALPHAWLRFDDRASGLETITLARSDGSIVPAASTEVACADAGFAEGTCVMLTPSVSLAPRTDHVIAVPASVRDRGGAAVGPRTVAFVTGDGAPPPVALVPPECVLDEVAADDTCSLVEDTLARVSLRATAPVRAFLDLAPFRAATVSPRGDVMLRIDGATPSSMLGGVLRLFDLSGRTTEIPIAFNFSEPLPDVVIDEIRADARGPEPAQEYVELWNRGSVALDLGGYRLSDRESLAGDLFPSPSSLAPGGRALVVADAFDPNATDDGVVPAGVPLIRIGSSIGSSGLANTGEPVFLRDARGRRVAEAPGLAPPGAGICVARRADASRLPRAGDYAPDPRGGCSPGTATPW